MNIKNKQHTSRKYFPFLIIGMSVILLSGLSSFLFKNSMRHYFIEDILSIGGNIFGVGIIVFFLAKVNKERNKDIDSKIEWIKDWLKSADKVTVNFDEVDVIHSSYIKQVEVDMYGNEVKRNKYILLQSKRYTENKSKLFYDSKITIPVCYKNKKYLYRLDLPIDGTKLKIWFYMQKEITLFIDKLNERKSKIDLSFIEEPHGGLLDVKLMEIRDLTDNKLMPLDS